MNHPAEYSSGVTAARLTPPGRGAVASIRLTCATGEQAMAIDHAFSAANGILPSTASVHRVLFGSWRGEDVVVVRTSETEWEVHCHGGEAAVSRILSEFDPGAAVQIPSAIDQLLLQTRTARTAQHVLAQSAGALTQALRQAADTPSTEEFRQCLENLLRWGELVDHLVEPWRVVIAGPPNVGKSSLMNAIAGYDRAIVYDQPGTTRDAVHTELVLDGWPFCFVDTAGIRLQTDDPVESQGITHARSLLPSADLVLIAVDATAGWTGEHDSISRSLSTNQPQAVVCCKSDLAHCTDLPAADWLVFHTSATQETGLRELTEWISTRLVPDVPAVGTALPVAGASELCSRLIEQLNCGHPRTDLQSELADWLQSQPWAADGRSSQTP